MPTPPVPFTQLGGIDPADALVRLTTATPVAVIVREAGFSRPARGIE